ncbi:hemin ABC transporter substrate-binding protein [Hansschlegelia quercus]|uniref:Hemin ABC transporter substrate-binding protein n=1 Tax=Hansschlegelia quercus TaxID=2528245 RepID=A0A4Q9GRT4_9HYPH|nr:ABC transporter substrate-binding protein [Hansschlegelia quercus]TBN54477.1 hemin ABC transporter substrate-binding protein [Hansschlegelia quercus]
MSEARELHPAAEISRRAVLLGMSASALALRPSQAMAKAAGDKIVTLGGGVTEIVYALGAGDRIVAVDLTSTYPAAARGKPNVGYYRRLSAEGVLALAPTAIVAADGAGPKETMDVLASAAVPLVSLAEVRRPGDVATRIRAVAEAIGEQERGTALADAVSADLSTLAEDIFHIQKRQRTLILLGPSNGGPLTAAGSQSTGALALELVGGDNVAASMTGWKPLVDEAVLALYPEAVIVMATGAPVSVDAVARHPALAGSAAVRDNRVVAADALGLVGFGPRVAHIAQGVAKRIYSDQAFRELPARPWTEQAPPK